MKNFKKALCLVLAIVMCLSIMTVAASAATGKDTYSDWSDVKNKDAVDLLTRLGAFIGTDAGTFAPNTNLSRAEAAQVFIRIHANPQVTSTNTLKKIQDTFKAVAADKFTDVAATKWYAGAIGYGVSNGYFAGTSATTYEPDAPITLVQAAKVLLCALGYDAKLEGFTGGTTLEKVTAVANAEGLYAGIDASNPMGAISRDDFAQMCANFLGNNMVKYGTDGKAAEDTTTSAMLKYYKKAVDVTTGVVIGNSYADVSALFDTAYAVADSVPGYDKTTETLLAVPGTCNRTGLCVIAHNQSANCPANTYTFATVDGKTGYAEFGQTVTMIEIYNGATTNGDPISVVAAVSANSATEDYYTAGGINTKASGLKLVDATYGVAGKTVPGSLVYAQATNDASRDGLVPTTGVEMLYNSVAAKTAPAAAAQKLNAGYMLRMFDFDGNGTADINLAIEKKIATVDAKHLNSSGVQDGWTLTGSVDVINAGPGYNNYFATELAKDDTVIYYKDAVGQIYVEKLDAKTGTFNLLTGVAASGDAAGVKIDSTEYLYSQTTDSKDSTKGVAQGDLVTYSSAKANIGKGMTYFLDKGNNVVKAFISPRASSTIFLYGSSSTSFWKNGTVKGVDKDGNVATYTVHADAETSMKAALDDYARYVKVDLVGTVIMKVAIASNYHDVTGTKLLAGSLVLGSANPGSATFDGTKRPDQVTAATKYVTDDTIFMYRTTATTSSALDANDYKTLDKSETVKIVKGIGTLAMLDSGEVVIKEYVLGLDGKIAIAIVDLVRETYVSDWTMEYGTTDDMSKWIFIDSSSKWTGDTSLTLTCTDLDGKEVVISGLAAKTQEKIEEMADYGLILKTRDAGTLNGGTANDGSGVWANALSFKDGSLAVNQLKLQSVSTTFNRIAFSSSTGTNSDTISTKGAKILINDGTGWKPGTLAEVTACMNSTTAYQMSYHASTAKAANGTTDASIMCATQAADIVLVYAVTAG